MNPSSSTLLEFSHEIYGEGFYTMMVDVQRLSESVDTIPVTVSERVVNINEDFTGQYVTVTGQFRSYNRAEKDNQRRLQLLLHPLLQARQ